MINQTLKKLLKEYQESNPDISQSVLSNIEHLVINEVMQMPYFKDSTSDLYASAKNDLYIDHNENITFYNDSTSSKTIIKDDIFIAGGYVMTRNEANRLSEIGDLLESATGLNDLVDFFTEEDAVLIQKFSVGLPKDELFSLMCMVKLKENINNDPDYKISYDQIYGKTMMRVYIEQGCSLDNDFQYSIGHDYTLRKHLSENIGILTQESLAPNTLQSLIRHENKTFINICDKYLVENPEASISPHKTIYTDLSPVLKNPIIRNNTTLGIIMDDSISGPEKLTKIYQHRYFEKSKSNFLNTIEFQMNKPTVEDLNQRYSNAVNTIVQKLESSYPILNTPRADCFYCEKSDYDFSKIFSTTRNKSMITGRDYLEQERTLINATMNGYFSKKLDGNNVLLVNERTDSLKMTDHQVVGYHNNIESILLLRTQNFGEIDSPSKERPNITVLSMLNFPNDLNNQAFDTLSEFIKEQEKVGMNVIINLKDISSHYSHYAIKLEEMKKHSNVILCNFTSFENKLTKMLEALHTYDVRTKVLTSEQKTSLLLKGLNLIATEIPHEVNSYNYDGGQKIVDFMTRVITNDLPKLSTYNKIENTLK